MKIVATTFNLKPHLMLYYKLIGAFDYKISQKIYLSGDDDNEDDKDYNNNLN